MKFGKYLRAQEVPGWEFYYLSYNRIKKQLVKEATTTTEVAQVQKNFQIALEKELEKINSFYQLKADQLYDNVLQAKQQIKEGQTSTEIDEELDRISSELIHLERFQKLNLMGFSKLLKKHDKHSQVEAKAWFMLRVEDQPFVKKDLDHILVQLSESWKLLKIARNKKTIEERKGEQNQPTAQVFERKTTKYWVPEDKMLEVKTMVIKHLPIDIFDKSVTRSDNLTTSVYYDSEDLELYHDRLQRNEGAVNLRMRTYGKGTTQPTVFVERKTHHDTWVGESSVKERFTIKRNKLYDFLHGRYNLDEKLKKAKNRKEMSDKEIEDTRRLSKEVQQLVMEHQLQPTVITRYTRTAFQMGRDASVRMSLDGDLHMIKEHGYIGNRWGRDLSEPVDEDDIVWFPYGILEVKLALTVGQETPEWITELLEKNKLIMVPKFSKFIHGCVTLFPEKVQLLPPWLPLLKAREITIEDKLYEFRTQTDTLVRKSIKEKEEKIPEKKPTQPQKIEIVTVPSTQKSPSVPSASAADRRVVERVPNDIEMESASLLGKPKKSLRDSSSKFYDSDDEKAKAPSPWQRVSNWFKSKFHKEEKKAQMPIKVDPKTFFANERTLLHWLSFLIVVQSIGIALMRFSTGYEPWRIGGIIFVGISLIFMGYSVLRYEQRRNAITKKIKGPYSDRFGPIILVTALLAAVIVNVVLVYKVYFANACAGASLLDLSFSKYEPNDILYHPVKGLVAVQSNTITYIDVDDKVTYDNWLPGQHSSVTFTDSAIPLLYIGQLYPPAIVEFNMESNSVQRVFPLKSFPGANSTNGVNALTYVPVSGHPEGGQFWVGSNADGGIYVYDIPIRTNTSSTVAQLASQMFPAPGDNQLNSLSYHPESNTVYTVYKNWLLNLNPSTGVAKANTLLGYPEVNGIAVKGEGKSMEIFVACIVCNDIYKFPFADGKTIKSGPCYPAVTSTSSASFLK